MLSTPGESDSEPGASTPDEPVPGQTHDRPQWRHQQKGGPVAACRHSPLPHQAELGPRHPRCGGELPVCQHVDLHFNCSASHMSPLLNMIPSGWGHGIQSEHQRRVCAEVPESFVCLAGCGCQWRGDGGLQARGGLPGWQRHPSVRGQGAWWVSWKLAGAEKNISCTNSQVYII